MHICILTGNFVLQADQHEKIKDEQGIFTFMHRWIIVTNDLALEYLQSDVRNLTHVTAVTYPASLEGQVSLQEAEEVMM